MEIEELFRLVYDQFELSSIFPEHNFEMNTREKKWQSNTYLDGTPHADRKDKTYISHKAPGVISEQGGENKNIIKYIEERDGKTTAEAIIWLKQQCGVETGNAESRLSTFLSPSLNANTNKSIERRERVERPVSSLKTTSFENIEIDIENEFKFSVEWLSLLKEKRGIDKTTLKAWGITGNDSSMQFNFMLDNQVVITKKRFKSSKTGKKSFSIDKKNNELIPYGMQNVEQGVDLVITEGEFDALTVWQCGHKNVVSVPNGAQSNTNYLNPIYDALKGCNSFILCVDNDEAGNTLREELILRLGVGKCKTVVYPKGCKDINEVLVNHGEQAASDVIKQAAYIPINFIENPERIRDQLRAYKKNGFPKGKKIGIQAIDEKIRQYYGNLCLITGTPATGKSELADQIALRLALYYGDHVAVYSRENEAGLYFANMIHRLMQRPIDKISVTENEYYEKVENFLLDKLHYLSMQSETELLGTDNLDDVLFTVENAVKRYGVKVFILDPFNYLEPDKARTKQEAVESMLNKLHRFAKVYNVLTLIVAHPKKMQVKAAQQDGDGNIPNPVDPVHAYDVADTANWFNKMDVIYSLHRPFKQKMVNGRLKKATETECYIQKVKHYFMGTEGVAELDYNMNTRCFHSLSDLAQQESIIRIEQYNI